MTHKMKRNKSVSIYFYAIHEKKNGKENFNLRLFSLQDKETLSHPSIHWNPFQLTLESSDLTTCSCGPGHQTWAEHVQTV